MKLVSGLVLLCSAAYAAAGSVVNSVSLSSRTYDPSEDQTTFVYDVDEVDPKTSDTRTFVLKVDDCTIASSSGGLMGRHDPSGVAGLLFSTDSVTSYTIVIDGNIPTGQSQAAYAKGASYDTPIVDDGPNCASADTAPTCDINVQAASDTTCSNDVVTVQLSSAGSAASYTWSTDAGTLSSTDSSSTVLSLTAACSLSTNVHLTVASSAGSQASCSATASFSYTSELAFASYPDNLAAEIDDSPPAPEMNLADADPCFNPVITLTTSREPPTGSNYVLTRTWTATDDCDTTGIKATQEVTFADSTPPVITGVPAETSRVDCDAVPAPCEATAYDEGDASAALVRFSETRADGSCPSQYTLFRTWTAEDSTGNPVTAKQTIMVSDNSNPVLIGVPASTSAECHLVPLMAQVTATDNCDHSVAVDAAEVRNADGTEIIRTWTATDSCGNDASASQTITISDNSPPTLVGKPADASATCDSIPVTCEVRAKDTCDSSVAVSYSHVSEAGSCADEYKIIHTWTAQDTAGNPVSGKQTVSISDNTPPEFYGSNDDIHLKCATVPDHTISADDDCSGSVEPSMSEERISDLNQNQFTLVRNFVATDACGNSATTSQTIYVNDDTPPSLAGTPIKETTVGCSAVPAVPTVSVIDNCACDTELTVDFTQDRVNGDCDDRYTLYRTWTSQDCSGNRVEFAQTITVVDMDDPVLALDGFQTSVPADCSDVPEAPVVSASDVCDTSMAAVASLDESSAAGSCTDEYTITRQYTATDDCGNTASATQVVSVTDTTAPALAGVPAHLHTPCDEIPAMDGNYIVTASDTCDKTATPNGVETREDGSCPYAFILTREYTTTDRCGNTNSQAQEIAVTDTKAPVFDDCVDETLTVEYLTDLPVNPGYDANDSCEGSIASSFDEQRTGEPCSEIVTRTWDAVDSCGNRARTCTKIYQFQDTQYPTVTAPEDVSLSCAVADIDAYVTANHLPNVETAAVDSGNAVTVSFNCVMSAGACTHDASYTCTFTARDGCGNIATDSFNVVIKDNEAPQYDTIPDDETHECSDGEPVAPTVTFSDNCGIEGSVTPAPVRENLTPTGQETAKYVLSWSAQDNCGSEASVKQTITMMDRTDPQITCNSPADIECDADAATQVITDVTSNDNCGTPVQTSTDSRVCDTGKPDGCDCTFTRTYTVTDSVGNQASCDVEYSIEDNAAPTCTVGDSTDVECSTETEIADLSCEDNCDASFSQTKDARTVNFERSADTKAVSASYRSWTVQDACGNSRTYTQTLTSVDLTAPTFDNAHPETAEYTCAANAVETARSEDDVTASDTCGRATVDYTVGAPSSECSPYTYTRFWTATDESGNTASATQVVSVTGSSQLVWGPGEDKSFDVTIEKDEDPIPDFATSATASDDCGSVQAECTVTRQEGSCSDSYTMINTCTATQSCGDAVTFTQSYHVEDTTAPTLPAMPDQLFSCDNLAAVPALGEGCSDAAKSCETCGGCYTFERTCSATDNCGNSASDSQTFTIVDLKTPTITVPADTTLDCNDPIPDDAASAEDNCGDTTGSPVVEKTTVHSEASRTTVRTFTFADECGLKSTKSQTVLFQDTTPPDACAGWDDTTVEVGEAYEWPTEAQKATCHCPNQVLGDDCTATDNLDVSCGEETIAGTCPNDYTRVFSWTTTDAAGLTNVGTYTVHIQDTEKPYFTNPGVASDITVQVQSISGAPSVTAEDAAGEVTVAFDETREDGSSPNHFLLIRTWTATDACSHTEVLVQTVTVIDTYTPNIVGVPSDIEISCDDPDNTVSEADVDSEIAHWADEGTVVDSTTTTVAGSCEAAYKIVRTFTATDVAGNTAQEDYTITVTDNNPPTWTTRVPEAVVDHEGCTDPEAPVMEAEDTCVTPNTDETGAYYNGGAVSVDFTVSKVDVGDKGDYNLVRVWTATDGCGNSINTKQTVKVRDTTDPVFKNAASLPGDVELQGCTEDIADVLECSDSCGACNVVMTTAAGDASCVRTAVIRTWTATDSRGNDITHRQVVSFTDVEDPTFTPVADVTEDRCATEHPPPVPVAGDDCDEAVNVDLTTNVNENDQITREWTATDDCGNTATEQQTVTLVDTVDPVLIVPDDATFTCAEDVLRPAATCSDDCDWLDGCEITEEETTSAGSCGVEYTITRTFTVTDGTNTVSGQQVITVVDDGAPMFDDAPVDVTIEACTVPDAVARTTTDCGGESAADATTDSVSDWVYVHTWTAVDQCGNTAGERQTITLKDLQKPVITCEDCSHDTHACDAGEYAACSCSVSDNCDEDLVAEQTDELIAGGCDGDSKLIRTWTVSDRYGNAADPVVQTISYYDAEAPQFDSLPARVLNDVECDAIPDVPEVVATDNCDDSVDVTHTATREGIAGEEYPYTDIHTWTTTDACGNTARFSQTVHVVDTTKPTFKDLPDNTSYQCDEVPMGDAIAEDNCDADVTVTPERKVISASCPEQYEFKWTVVDAAGNSQVAVRTVTVQDTEDPVLDMSGIQNPVVKECESTAQPALPTNNDNCGATSSVETTIERSTAAPEILENYIRVWRATDACGNYDEQYQTVTSQDTTPPEVTCTNCADTEIVGCNADSLMPVPVPASNDACHGILSPDLTRTNEGSLCSDDGLKTIWTYTATDDSGHTTSKSNTVTIKDSAAPSMRGVPSDDSLDCSELADFTWSTVTQDDCKMSGTESTTVTPVLDTNTDAACPNDWSITATWTSSDDCGNTDTKSSTVTFYDNTPPTLILDAATITAECSAVPVAQTPTATDDCTAYTISSPRELTTAGSCSSSYTLTRSWTVTDECGLQDTKSRVIEVSDNFAPTIANTCADDTVECSDTPPACSPTATDECSVPEETFEENSTAGDSIHEYTITRTWTFCDDCGNCATDEQVLSVVDTTDPGITGPDDVTAEVPAIPKQYDGSNTADDNCATPTVDCTSSRANGDCDYNYVLSYICTATDEAGNSATHTQRVHVFDTTPPELHGVPAHMTVEYGEVPTFTEVLEHVFATDNSNGELTVSSSETEEHTTSHAYTIFRVFSVVDECGNRNEQTQTIVVQDTCPPTLSDYPDDQTADCDAVPVLCDLKTVGEDLPVQSTEVDLGGGKFERTWTATDEDENTVTHKQTVTVVDNASPVLSRTPSDTSVSCSCEEFPAAPQIVALDNCDESVTVTNTEDRIDGAGDDNYKIVRTWVATDSANNNVRHEQTITVVDDEAPTIYPVPQDADVSCANVPATPEVKALDNCDPNPTVETTEVTTAGACADSYTITRTFTTMDRNGESNTYQQVVAVSDSTAPLVGAIEGACVSASPAGIDSVRTASFALSELFDTSDDCSAAPSISVISCNSTSAVAPSCSQDGDSVDVTLNTRARTNEKEIRVYVRVEDSCGNNVNTFATITLADTKQTAHNGLKDCKAAV